MRIRRNSEECLYSNRFSVQNNKSCTHLLHLNEFVHENAGTHSLAEPPYIFLFKWTIRPKRNNRADPSKSDPLPEGAMVFERREDPLESKCEL